MTHETLLLSASDVARCIDLPEVIRAVEAAFFAHGVGRVAMPPKLGLDLARFGKPNWFHAMPSYVPDAGACGIKWNGGVLDNPDRRGLPYILGTFILSDPDSALPLAIMDSTTLTAMRTGAAAAVGAKYLARTSGPATVAILGAGTQGRTCLEAINHVLPIGSVRVFDCSAAAADRFVRDMERRVDRSIRCVRDGDEAVAGADIVVTATTARAPLFCADAAGPGVYIAAMGSYPELDPELVLAADKLVVDSVDQNLARAQLGPLFESGRLRPENLYAELGDIVAGKKPGREHPNERIIACLIGMSTEDVVVAARVRTAAERRGIGQRFAFYR